MNLHICRTGYMLPKHKKVNEDTDHKFSLWKLGTYILHVFTSAFHNFYNVAKQFYGIKNCRTTVKTYEKKKISQKLRIMITEYMVLFKFIISYDILSFSQDVH